MDEYYYIITRKNPSQLVNTNLICSLPNPPSYPNKRVANNYFEYADASQTSISTKKYRIML